ncbi:MAG TPA: AAA family ATPase [Methylomirabilota bacterium]
MPLVGRGAELDRLRDARALAWQGNGQVAILLGEAGIGKTRLVAELARDAVDHGARVLVGRAREAERIVPFGPWVNAVRTGRGLSEARVLERVWQDELARLFPELGLGGNPAGEDPGRLFEAVARLLLRIAGPSPLLLVLEDLHWADEMTLRLLAFLHRRLERQPVLLAGTAREEELVDAPMLGRVLAELGAEGRCQRFTLSRLTRADVERLVTSMTRPGTEAAAVTRLTARTWSVSAGNPLIAIEALQILEGMNVPVPPSQPLSPRSRDVLAGRLERSSERARYLAAVAAVIGREFEFTLLERAARLPAEETARGIEELVARRVLHVTGERLDFTHDLIRDIVHAQLLPPRRQVLREQVADALQTLYRENPATALERLAFATPAALHEQVAVAIEQAYGDRLDAWAEILVHHWSRTSRTDKSVQYLAMAGRKSLRVYALEEAHERFRQVAALADAAPEGTHETALAEIVPDWARVHYHRKDFRGLIALGDRYLARVEALGDSRHLAMLLFWIGVAHFNAVQYGAGRPLMSRALALGETLADPQCMGYASMGLMWVQTYAPAAEWRGQVERLANRAIEVSRTLDDVYLAAETLRGLAVHHLTYGRYNAARETCLRLVALGRQAEDLGTAAMGLWILGFVNVFDERYVEAIDNADEALRVSPNPLDRLGARGAKGAALVFLGRSQEGLNALLQAQQEMVSSGFLPLRLGIDLPYGVALVLAGRMQAGVHWIEECIRRFVEWGNETAPALGHLTLGEIHLALALRRQRLPLTLIARNLSFLLRAVPVAGRRARLHLEEAARRARDADIPAVLARALLGLGTLAARRGAEDEARQHFAEARRLALPHSTTLAEKIDDALARVRRAPASHG